MKTKFNSIPLNPRSTTMAPSKISCSSAVRALVAAYGEKAEQETDTAIADLIADLRHLCDHLDINFFEVNERANEYYDNEKADSR